MVKATEKKTLIQDTKAKSVTFSKRRSGIFKKACELCTLCGVEMAIIFFSPTGKAYAFGNPSVEAIINRFSNDSATFDAYASNGEDGSQEGARLSDLYKEYFDLVAQVEAEEKRAEELKQRRSNYPNISKMNMNELLEFKASLENFKQFLDREMEVSSKKLGSSSLTEDDGMCSV